jgi:autophagy-related protein 17
MDDIDELFDEAKQALSVAGPICTQVNHLLVTNRQLTEDGAVQWAQIEFMCDAMMDQCRLLDQLRGEFQERSGVHLRQLQQAMGRVEREKKTMDQAVANLGMSLVDPGLGHDEGHNLREFVAEQGIQGLRDRIEAAMKGSSDIISARDNLIKELDGEVSGIRSRAKTVENANKIKLEHTHESTNTIAEHAHAMAEILQSLTRHYDLTLKAIELHDNRQDPDELAELRQVLDKDRHEVPEVIEELKERLNDAEAVARVVREFHKEVERAHQEVAAVAGNMKEFGEQRLADNFERLEGLVKDSNALVLRLGTLETETSAVASYYRGFSHSYHYLILEIVRRRKQYNRLQALVRDMSERFQKLYDEESEMRQLFIQRHGPYLPGNLWQGLADAPPKIDIIVDEPQLPTLSQETLSRAVQATTEG